MPNLNLGHMEDKKIVDLGAKNAVLNSQEKPGEPGNFYDRIPIKKMHDQALHIFNHILPEVEKKRGKDSADYKFFREVYRSLLWAIVVVDRNDFLVRKWQNSSMMLEIFKQRSEAAERELQKYTTMEDLYLSEAMDHIAAGVKNRVDMLIQNEKKR
jgi:hypothetical protein